MTTPLYRQHNAPPKPPDGCHLGLWYTNFFNRYNDQWTLDATAKSDWISSIAHKQCGDSTALEQQALRLLQLVQTLNGQFAICQTNWHFATGLGLPHPVENGLAWHPTLGVPFIAGSGMKGLLRAWVEVWDETDRAQRLINWFGEQEQAGQLIFFDAIPTKLVRLTTDIMTPHWGKWYEQGHDIPGQTMATVLKQPDRLPADWHEPVPVPFLAVKPNTPFFVAVAARNNDHKLAQTALNALIDALQWLGAGAKTAAGYGHMIRDESAEQYLLAQLAKAEKERQRLLEEQQQAEQIQQLPDFIQVVIQESPPEEDYITLSNALKKGRWQNNREQEQQVAEYTKKRMQEAGKWKETSNAKNPKKDKDHQRTEAVNKICRNV